jgi:hypothetical protein
MNKQKRHVFDLLDEIRARPTMYIRGGSLRELETYLYGYYAGLRGHGIIEPVPQMWRHFSSWLYWRTGWSQSLGWAFAIDQHYRNVDTALSEFFLFVDKYRQLQPTRVCSVRLRAKNTPTGKRVVIGFDGRIEKPLCVDVIRYVPEPLHFLRFHYPGRIEDDNLLTAKAGDRSAYRTTVATAKKWVRDELQVPFADWKKSR